MTMLRFMCMTYLITFSKGDQCKNNQHCSDCDRTGRCRTDCDSGYYDRKCRSVCSRNCRNRSCLLSISGTGACTEGCVPGYQGLGCNVRCDNPGGTCVACPGGCDGGYCQLGSSCVSGCVDSYYGTDCKTCSSRCKSCNRMTGLCKQCSPEYFGPNCAYSCDHCLGSCEHRCAEGCLPGLYGIFCDEKCSEKCGPDPNVSTSKYLQALKAGSRHCHRDSGDCINGCKEGWFGQQCSSPCSTYCRRNTCHPDTGKCTYGCTHGFYGGLCRHTCNVCLDGVCDQKTGTCTLGCYLTGRTCEQTCTLNCSIAECLRVEYCSEGYSDSGIDDLRIGLSTAFSLFVVIILLALSPVYCKHLTTKKQHNVPGIIQHEAPSQEDQVLPDYCEILNEEEEIMCELQEMSQRESVNGDAPAMPVLADCFAPDNDVAATNATNMSAAVDDNTYSHLTRPVVVDVPETVVKYVSPIRSDTM